MKHIVLLIVLPSKTTTILQLFATSDEYREYTVMSVKFKRKKRLLSAVEVCSTKQYRSSHLTLDGYLI